jgi:NAD(P)-dependent dehydrogenase (short-subunit alcohol dehydrogenase family)
MPLTWLITGCSRGLGRALAEAVAAAGDRLVATARDPDTLADLVNRYPDRVLAVALDVTERERAVAAVEAAEAVLGRLDVLVNNAGYADVNSIEDFAEDDFRAQIETNLWGVINVTRAALPVMRAQGSGRIIQISSIGGRTNTAGLGPYQTAKWGVEGFSGVLAKEVAPLGIHVTLVEPGGFATDWAGRSMTVHDVRDAYRPTVGATAFDHPIGDPDKAAQAIMRLATLHDPPPRLLLGSDAYRLARAAEEERAAVDEAWRDLTLSTDR